MIWTQISRRDVGCRQYLLLYVGLQGHQSSTGNSVRPLGILVLPSSDNIKRSVSEGARGKLFSGFTNTKESGIN
jgi:hypothetical protein